MSGITSGTGLFSGIDTASLISQLLAIEARPKVLAQSRILQLKSQQAAYLDLNTKVSALKSAAAAFRTSSIFQANKATSSATGVLSATASATAIPGAYTFIVDRLVSTQQLLSRGFADATTTGLNAGAFTFESAAARLDRETSLADLNGGEGIKRGKIVITETTSGKVTTVDLSRAGTVSDVLDAINSSGAAVSASVDGGRLVIASTASDTIAIANGFGHETATSLGIAAASPAATVTGSQVYRLGTATALGALNDGNGVFVSSLGGAGRYDFRIVVDGATTVNMNIGAITSGGGTVTSPPPTTLDGVIQRINSELETALGTQDVKAAIAPDGVSLRLVDAQGRTLEVLENPTTTGSSTARDLGLLTAAPQTGTVAGTRILAGMNSTLARTLNGGQGVAGDGQVSITARDGSVHAVTLDTAGSLHAMLAAIGTQTGGKITAALNRAGTGILLTDTTGGTSNLIVSGATAASLGIDTVAEGVAAATVDSGNLQHQYLTMGTTLASLRSGQGIGTGVFRITDSTGATQTVNLGSGDKTVEDLVRLVNSRGLLVKARVNDKGDGILLYEDGASGSLKIKVEDVTGTVAANLNIKGEAAGAGPQNIIDGTSERTVAFAPGDTLTAMVTKINAAGLGVSAAIINDGSGSTPFHLSLTARGTGSAGRFVVDPGTFDLGATTLDRGQDARVFFGSADPATAVLLSSSRNTMDQVVSGVSIDLTSTSATPVTLTIARDTSAVESALNTFISAFNTLSDRIGQQTRYDQESKAKGPLLGESTALQIRAKLYSTIQGKAVGVSGPFQGLADIGIKVGSGGRLELDRDRLRVALEQDYQAVADLVSARVQEPAGTTTVAPGVTVTNTEPTFSKLGVASQIENMAEAFINSVTGTLTRRGKTLTDQIELQTKRIADFDIRLANRRTILTRQFIAMEQAIGQLQTQGQALAGMSQLIRR
ncbi:MAG: flagellar filament capping protein FliD [Phycisphaerales bacterium]